MLRKFGESNLFKIALDKLQKIKKSKKFNIYIAVGEKEFFNILKKYNFNTIIRSKRSVMGQKINDIWDYIPNVKNVNFLLVLPDASTADATRSLPAPDFRAP